MRVCACACARVWRDDSQPDWSLRPLARTLTPSGGLRAHLAPVTATRGVPAREFREDANILPRRTSRLSAAAFRQVPVRLGPFGLPSQGAPLPGLQTGTGPRPVRNWAAQRERAKPAPFLPAEGTRSLAGWTRGSPASSRPPPTAPPPGVTYEGGTLTRQAVAAGAGGRHSQLHATTRFPNCTGNRPPRAPAQP